VRVFFKARLPRDQTVFLRTPGQVPPQSISGSFRQALAALKAERLVVLKVKRDFSLRRQTLSLGLKGKEKVSLLRSK
jgi:hypothetical protein